MIAEKDVKVGSRIMVKGRRCVVRHVDVVHIVVDPISIDACEDIPVGTYVDCHPGEDVVYEEWGITKHYAVSLVVAVDMDHCQDQPNDDVLQRGLDAEYDGAMTIRRCDFELVEVEENELPSNYPAGDRLKRIAKLREQMQYLLDELSEAERKSLEPLFGDITC
jgi:hypothetical protein